MPSFDIVVRTDRQEVDNAVNQALKEMATRYDFKGSKSRIDWNKESEIVLFAEDDFKLRAVVDILHTKLVRRNVSLKNLVYAKPEHALGGAVRQKITLQDGIPVEKAREIVKMIKDTKLKIQGQIQDNQVRVTGKKKDELQQIMTLVRKAESLGFDFQFVNYRD